ncbi:MAG: phage integrase N-terminal SAM-like domain-containing protein [Fidelibacterota bacterium]
MGQLRNEMENQLKLEGYSYYTRKSYLQHVKQFVAFYRKDPRQLTAKDIEKYLLYLLDEKKVSRSYVNQAVSRRQAEQSHSHLIYSKDFL